MSASQTTMDKLYGMRLSVMAQAYRHQEEMLSVADMTFDCLLYTSRCVQETGPVLGFGGICIAPGF